MIEYNFANFQTKCLYVVISLIHVDQTVTASACATGASETANMNLLGSGAGLHDRDGDVKGLVKNAFEALETSVVFI